MMKRDASAQADLFGAPTRSEPAFRSSSRPRLEVDVEAAARLVDQHGDYRVVRRLRPRAPVGRRPLLATERLGIIADVETTGLDHARDQVIEIGLVAFVYDVESRVIEVADMFSALHEPTIEIPPDVTRLTGITMDMVRGEAIDSAALEAFIADADLFIAHNAGFDRTFCERLARGFADRPWVCSVREIDWATLGARGSKLEYLLAGAGWFHDAHRATGDCQALLEILAQPAPVGAISAFSQLLAAADRVTARVWAIGSPYETKDVLKGRGYKWSDGGEGSPRSWWIEVGEAALEGELRFLQDLYAYRGGDPLVQRLTAVDRHKGR